MTQVVYLEVEVEVINVGLSADSNAEAIYWNAQASRDLIITSVQTQLTRVLIDA